MSCPQVLLVTSDMLWGVSTAIALIGSKWIGAFGLSDQIGKWPFWRGMLVGCTRNDLCATHHNDRGIRFSPHSVHHVEHCRQAVE